MKLLIGNVPVRLMTVAARLMPVAAWTPACAADQFYKKAGSKKPSQFREGFSFSNFPNPRPIWMKIFKPIGTPFNFRDHIFIFAGKSRIY